MDKISELRSLLMNILNKYSLSTTSEDAVSMLKECAPLLVELKECLGHTNDLYLEVSTSIAQAALRMVVKNVNDNLKQNHSNGSAFTVTIRRALIAMCNIESLDLIPEFRSNNIIPNKQTLSDMAMRLRISSEYFTPSIDLRTDDELFHQCKSLDDYRKYIKQYPEGKHIEEALKQVKKAGRRDKYVTTILLGTVIIPLLSVIVWIIYMFVAADDIKYNEISKDKAGYLSYIDEYPDGKHSNEVLNALYDIYIKEDIVELVGFSEKYSHTTQGKYAKEYASNIIDSLYNIACQDNTIKAWDLFIMRVPANYEKDAYTRRSKVYQDLYDRACKRNSIKGWREYKSQVPPSEYKDADERIGELTWSTESSAWSMAKDWNTIEMYEKYLNHHPNGAHAISAKKKIIDLKVSAIGAAGGYGTLPAMDRTSWGSGSTSTITIENDTKYTLTLLYSGVSQSREIKITSGGTRTFTLDNGEYRIAASVNASSVQSFYGKEILTGGSYSASYYISTVRY